MTDRSDSAPHFYRIRFFAFLLSIAAIIDKNRR